MFNKIRKLTIITLGALLAGSMLAAHVYAANLSVRVEQPKSPTNQTSFDINFVVLDILGRTVTVKCFKQGPSDGSYVQFGSDQSFANGGNSGSCNTGSGVFSPEGNYSFRIDASAGGDGASDTTSVTYDNSGPGDVRDYNKNHSGSCQYTIHFRTADDSGKTVKVELYRSDSVPFNADSGSRTQSIAAGSNETHDVTDTPPDCGKSYYYALRAFDSAGNGSALIGDNVTNNTVITPTPGQQQSAIPVSSTNGNVLGASSGTLGAAGTTGESGQVKGLSTPSAEVVNVKTPSKNNTARNLVIGGGILLFGALIYVFWSRRKNQTPA